MLSGMLLRERGVIKSSLLAAGMRTAGIRFMRSLVYTSEHHNHWATSHAINSNGYWKPTPEQRAELDAEWARHLAANRANTRALQLAVHEALGDIDEPQDLIECAATLAPR